MSEQPFSSFSVHIHSRVIWIRYDSGYFDDSVTTEGLVNDTLTGDPLMTVPILTSASGNSSDDTPSLCYEVHGQRDRYFNLISDNCTSVNAFYEKAVINSPNIDLNVVTKIGVRAVEQGSTTCTNIEVDLDSCTTMINGAPLNTATYSINGINIRRSAGNKSRVRISVPNCSPRHQLVMWVFCASGMVEDPVTWEYFSAKFIRFVVMRGLNLNDYSHGLIGESL